MSKKILIFGGSGFIGASLTKALAKDNEVCVICTNTKKALDKFNNNKDLQIKNISIFDKAEIKNLVKDYDVIINLIGKLFETKKGEFNKFHYQFVQLLSKSVSNKQHLIHFSALAVEKSYKTSIYAKTKLEGQKAIIKHSKNYHLCICLS